MGRRSVWCFIWAGVIGGLLFIGPSLLMAETGLGVSVGVSTLGVGAQLSWKPNPYVGLRAGYNYFTYSYDGSTSDVDYDFDLDLSNAPLLIDVHPFGGSFRLTGGVLFNWNSLDADAKGHTIELDGQEFDISDGWLKGDIDFNTVAPYAGFGWSWGGDKGLQFALDFGVVFQGSPDVDLDADNRLYETPGFKEALKAEEDRLQDEVDNFEYYPVISIGLGFRF